MFALPRFVELWGELQHLDAVLGAWAGDPQPLATLLPERPRFVTDLADPELRRLVEDMVETMIDANGAPTDASSTTNRPRAI